MDEADSNDPLNAQKQAIYSFIKKIKLVISSSLESILALKDSNMSLSGCAVHRAACTQSSQVRTAECHLLTSKINTGRNVVKCEYVMNMKLAGTRLSSGAGRHMGRWAVSHSYVRPKLAVCASSAGNEASENVRSRPEYIPGRIDDPNYVRIFDTTLRDGEQSPGASMTSKEKLDIARQLSKLGTHVQYDTWIYTF